MLEWIASSCFLILAALFLRWALGQGISARMRYALWGLVLLRLLVPVQLFTAPVAGIDVPVNTEALHREILSLPTVRPAEGGAVPGNRLAADAPDRPSSAQPSIDGEDEAAPSRLSLNAAQLLLGLWALGSGALAAVLVWSNVRFLRTLRRERQPLRVPGSPLPVYVVRGLPSPCLYGLLRPAVYVTGEAAENEEMLRHVLTHETVHYRHGDHIWSLLRCLALVLHWWNPLVWLAAALSRRDGELACDEGALRRLGDGERSAYGNTLLALVTAKSAPGDLLLCATTMSEDKKRLYERIRQIACRRRVFLSATVLATVLALLAACSAFTRAASDGQDRANDSHRWSCQLELEGEVNGRAVVYKVLTNTEELTFQQVFQALTSSGPDGSLPDFELEDIRVDGVSTAGNASLPPLGTLQAEDLSLEDGEGISPQALATALNEAKFYIPSHSPSPDTAGASAPTIVFHYFYSDRTDHQRRKIQGATLTLCTPEAEEAFILMAIPGPDGDGQPCCLTGGKLVQLMRRALELDKEQPTQPDVQGLLLDLQAEDLALADPAEREAVTAWLREAAWEKASRLYDFGSYATAAEQAQSWKYGNRDLPLADGSTLHLAAGEMTVYITWETEGRASAAAFYSDGLHGWVTGADPGRNATGSSGLWLVNTPWSSTMGTPLSKEDSRTLQAMLDGGTWEEGTPRCAADLILCTEDRKTAYTYHSDCGTVHDRAGSRSLSLPEEQREALRELLGRYVSLGPQPWAYGINQISLPVPEGWRLMQSDGRSQYAVAEDAGDGLLPGFPTDPDILFWAKQMGGVEAERVDFDEGGFPCGAFNGSNAAWFEDFTPVTGCAVPAALGRYCYLPDKAANPSAEESCPVLCFAKPESPTFYCLFFRPDWTEEDILSFAQQVTFTEEAFSAAS